MASENTGEVNQEIITIGGINFSKVLGGSTIKMDFPTELKAAAHDEAYPFSMCSYFSKIGNKGAEEIWNELQSLDKNENAAQITTREKFEKLQDILGKNSDASDIINIAQGETSFDETLNHYIKTSKAINIAGIHFSEEGDGSISMEYVDKITYFGQATEKFSESEKKMKFKIDPAVGDKVWKKLEEIERSDLSDKEKLKKIYEIIGANSGAKEIIRSAGFQATVEDFLKFYKDRNIYSDATPTPDNTDKNEPNNAQDDTTSKENEHTMSFAGVAIDLNKLLAAVGMIPAPTEQDSRDNANAHAGKAEYVVSNASGGTQPQSGLGPSLV